MAGVEWKLTQDFSGRQPRIERVAGGGDHAQSYKLPMLATTPSDALPVADQLDRTKELLFDPLENRISERLAKLESFRRWHLLRTELAAIRQAVATLEAKRGELVARRHRLTVEAEAGLIGKLTKIDAEVASIDHDLAARSAEIISGEQAERAAQAAADKDLAEIVQAEAQAKHASLQAEYAEVLRAIAAAVGDLMSKALSLDRARQLSMNVAMLTTRSRTLLGSVVPVGVEGAKPVGSVPAIVVTPPAPPAPTPQPPMFPTAHPWQPAPAKAEVPAGPIPGLPRARVPYAGGPK